MSEAQPPRFIPSLESTRHFHPVLRPDLGKLYRARAARLNSLAQGHELAEYLLLAAKVADAQAAALATPTEDTIVAQALSAEAPLQTTSDALPVVGVDPVQIARQGAWLPYLDAILTSLEEQGSDAVAPHVQALRDMSAEDRIAAGLALAEGRFEAVAPASAPFLWSALSLEVALSARVAALPAEHEEEAANCPLCGCPPVASLIHTGDDQGLRYLHCAMCECEWHMVRAKCTNCGDAGQLDYLSFDTTEAVVRAESCGHCGGYLKVVSQERDPAAEAVADDLATLVLDDAAASEGYGRTGFNPFALPQGES